MYVELLLVCLVVFLVYKIDKKPDKLPPGPWGLPIIGDLFRGGILSNKQLTEFNDRFGKVFSRRVGSELFVYITDYQTIKSTFSLPEVQGRPDQYTFKALSFFENVGILLAYGKQWKSNRKFALKLLRDLGLGQTRIQDSIQYEVKELMDHLSSQVGQPVSLSNEIKVAVFNVLSQIIANKRYSIDDKELSAMSEMMTRLVNCIQGPLALFNVFPLLRKLPSSIRNTVFGEAKFMDEFKFLTVFGEGIIKEHEDKLDPQNPIDYIDHYLLEMKKGHPEADVRRDALDLMSTVGDLFAAGIETTTATLGWMLLLMAKHPEEQLKVQAAIDGIVARDEQPSLEHRERLVYVEAMILEVLRFTSFVSQGVQHSNDTDIYVDGYTIPKGSSISGCIEHCHRNSKYFERPDEFYPGHFIDQKGKLIVKKEGFLPFATGRRQCLGETMAKMEIYLFTATLLQNYFVSLAPNEDVDLEHDPSKPLFNFAKPFRVVLQKR